MGIRIGSNISSLQAQRRLGEASAQLSSSFERLSSGLRINRASDDAAGLAVSSSLTSGRRIYSQGVRNLNDGISALTIADGAIENLSRIVTRLSELAEQSANGTLGARQRKSIDAEAQALAKEYSRISKVTEFNGLKLFDGSIQGLRLQAGSGTDGSILSSLGGDMGTGDFGTRTIIAGGTGPTSSTLGDLNGDGALDLVSADQGGTMSVYLGNGDGSFKARTNFTAGNTPFFVSLGDLNNDGNLDMAGVDKADNTISVYIGNGDGTFMARTSMPSNNTPYCVILGDFNGDGAVDMASADGVSRVVTIYTGNGDGTFKARNSYAVGNIPMSLSAADLNSDGILDVVSADFSTNTTSVLIGKVMAPSRPRMSSTEAPALDPAPLETSTAMGCWILRLRTTPVATSACFSAMAMAPSGPRPFSPPALSRTALPLVTSMAMGRSTCSPPIRAAPPSASSSGMVMAHSRRAQAEVPAPSAHPSVSET